MQLLVVGAGAMGRWFGRALTAAAEESVSVTVTDADGETADRAADALGATPASPSAAADPAEPFDLVCIAVPIPAATDAIARYAPATETAVCDLTGTMAGPVAAMREHASDCERASFHPLFAPENEPGNVAVVSDETGPVTDAVRAALSNRGNSLFETTPEEHDEAMETVQAKAHTAVLAYALAAESVDDRFHTPVSSPLADLVEQVTTGEARVYADIQAAFDGASEVAHAARELSDADGTEFEALYEDAGK